MPTIGGVYIPDDWTPSMPAPERPGLVDVFTGAAATTAGQLRYGLPYQARKLVGDISAEDERYYQSNLQRVAAENAPTQAASLSDVGDGRVGIGRWIAENLAASIPYMAGTIAGAGAGFLAGGPPGALAGAVVGGTPQFSASNVDRAVQEEGGLSGAAALRSLAVAPIQSAADAAIGKFIPGIGRVSAETAAKGFLRRTAESVAKAAGTEGVTEAVQQIGERYAAGMPLGTPDAAAEYVNAAVTGMAVGGVLGAGGGFRRTNAVAKPADAVTELDLEEHINQGLAGELRYLPAPPPQPDLVSSADGVTRVNPNGTIQLALPSPEMFPPPTQTDLYSDQAGVTAPTLDEVMIEQNRPRVLENTFLGNLSPDLQQLFDQVAQPGPNPLTASTSLSSVGLPEAPAGVELPVGANRAFGDVAIDDLDAALRLKSTPDNLRAEAEAEVAKRYEEASGRRELTTDDFQTRLAEAKRGLRGGFVQAVEAASPSELVNKVYDQVFIDQDTRSNTAKFAQRLGLLDDKLQPTALANEIEAARKAAPEAEAPVDFAPEWEQIKRDAGIQRLKSGQALATMAPTSRSQAETQVMEALAGVDAFTAPKSDQVEAVARQLGLVTNDAAMDITPEGRKAFLRGAGGLEAVVQQAQAQGFTGAQASAFESGARRGAQGGEARTEFDNFSDMAAYEAGRAWAEDFVQTAQVPTAAQSEATSAKGSTARVDRAPLSPGQVQQRSLNRLLDAADLSKASEGDRAALYRMVRDGRPAAEVGAALEQVQQGKSIFSEAPRAPRELGEAATTVVRGQPQFREMNRERGYRPEARRDNVKTMLLEDIQRAFDSGDMDAAERIAAVAEVSRGDLKKAVERLSSARGMLPSLTNLSPTESYEGQAILRLAREARSARPMLELLAEIPTEIGDMAKRLLKAGGNDVPVSVVTDERMWELGDPDATPEERLDSKIEGLYDPNTDNIYLHEDMVRAGTFLHEYAHALTARHVQARTQIGREITKIYEMFQKAHPDDGAYGFSSPHEFVAEIYGNRSFRNLLRDTQVRGGVKPVSLWDKIVDVLRRVFGKAQPDFVERVMELTDDAAKIQVPDSALGLSPQAALRMESRTAEAQNDVTRGLAAQLSNAVDAIPRQNLRAGFRRQAIQWQSHNQLDRSYGPQMPGLIMHSDAHRFQGAVNSRFQQMGDGALQAFEMLENANPRAAQRVGELMATTTEFQLDPFKPWKDHTHLGVFTVDDNGAIKVKDGEQQNYARLKGLYDKTVGMRNDLSRGDQAGIKVFNQFRALNEVQNYSRMAAGLHRMVATDPELAQGVADADINPVDQFMRTDGLDTPEAARDAWAGLLNRTMERVQAFVDAKKGAAAQGSETDLRAAEQHYSPIEMQIAAIHEALAAMQKAPYFHLGRFGDYFGSAVVRSENGIADPKALAHVAQALETAGFDDVQISTDSTRPRLMLRFDTVDQTERFQQLMMQLQQQGWLDSAAPIKSGRRQSGENFGAADGLPAFVARYIEAIKTSPEFIPAEGASADEKANIERRKQDAVRVALDTWLEQQPDSALSKVLVKRFEIPGYKKDMARNWAHRWRVGSTALAKTAAAPKFSAAYESMRSQVNQAQEAFTPQAEQGLRDTLSNRGASEADIQAAVERRQNEDRFLLHDLLAEMNARDAVNPLDETGNVLDQMRAYSHAYFLGMSPAYGLINMTQLGVTTLPELAKTHGFKNSMHAIFRGGRTALKIMGAISQTARELGWQRWADLAITDEVLKRAGLSDAERNFAQHMLATGTIDIGSASRALGQVATNRAGSGQETALKYASAIGSYTETFSRLAAAFAARELHGNKPGAEAYASQVVSESMFDYQHWNTARKLGKRGVLGPVTPIVTQFMSYSVQVLEKLMSEMTDAIGVRRPGETEAQAAARATASRRFIAAHMGAVMTLAGSLGLPFATAIAGVIDRLVDAIDDDDEPYDSAAAFRGFVSDVFGQEFGEVISRGVPRALGLDISTRAGEQNILPFTEFLVDRRPWKEAVDANVGRSLGAVPSMIGNIWAGGGKIADGDLLGGMKDVLPVAFKSPLEVYRMTEQGYVDSKGNKLPMTPRASAYLWQALGFSPAAKAEYGEARADQAARRGDLSREATQLRQQIVKALVEGDREQAAELVQRAQQFDQDNPAFAVIPSLAGAMTRQAQAQAQARALGTPVGVRPSDLDAQSLTRYANIY